MIYEASANWRVQIEPEDEPAAPSVMVLTSMSTGPIAPGTYDFADEEQAKMTILIREAGVDLLSTSGTITVTHLKGEEARKLMAGTFEGEFIRTDEDESETYSAKGAFQTGRLTR